MKFTCPKCSTRHTIADGDLPPGQALRFTCPECKNTINVRRRDDSAKAAAKPAAAPAPTAAAVAAANAAAAAAVPAPVAERPAPATRPPPDSVNPFDLAPNNLEPMPSDPTEPGYVNAPPGEATRLFMQTAGIYRRRRNARIAAVASVASIVLIVGTITADKRGWISIPFMGMVYDMTGMPDPQVHRAIERTEAKLADSSLSPAEKEKLRSRMLGLEEEPAAPAAVKHHPKAVAVTTSTPPPAAAPPQQPMAAPPIPGLPSDGEHPVPGGETTLSQEAITKVVHENNRSLTLCYAEASKKGSVANGKMEVQLTIQPSGDVTAAEITTPKYKGSPMGECTLRRVKNWKFPSFSGEAVTAVFPYVLSSGF